ncbi:hypothetical protein D9615_006827 [Tricholomella constricta]|uniref:Protein-S-isoprenylcysteine O-methyltransferase n=1 Tax=Tricholomella constricta TaxID=117010 RepID=A0A8H5H6Y7_9AGAR|nr:hypothetical protein D9615_006827 [Tricholomella constricta]
MSLLKLPLLATVAWGIHTTMTAPNPPPTVEERLPPTGIEHLVPVVPSTSKVLFWTASLAEMATIIANHLPTHTLSQHILRLLVRTPPSTASNLRTTFPFLLGWSLALAGALLRRHCYRTLDTKFTFELSIRKDHRLVTHGPYAYVRHPSYTGALIAGAGTLMCLLAPGSWLRECSGLWRWDASGTSVVLGVFVAGAAVARRALAGRMRREDEMLRARFGEEWERWAMKVPWRLVPGLY